MQGPTNVARLCFQTVANQPSTNMPLPVIDVDGVKPGGATVANAYGYPGRVIVIGSQPLLEAALLPNRMVQLTLYGPPGATIRLESAERLVEGATDWKTKSTTTATGAAQPLPSVSADRSTRFFRAVRE